MPQQPASPQPDGAPTPSPAPELLALRNEIDQVDHTLIKLLAERQKLVGRVAAIKRTKQVPIRDAGREAALLKDRRALADSLSVSSDVVESLFRLILWSSRDRQAALLTELPKEVTPATVAIIGGSGGMGQVFARLFSELNNQVLIVDQDTDLPLAPAVKQAQVVLISVPIDVTANVIGEVGPLLNADQVLLDLTSIKTEPIRTMLDNTTAEVVGTHPLFGPSVHSLQGQRIVITPGRGERWLNWLRQIFKARGLVMVETTPEKHDELMAIVQVLTHYSTEVLGRTLERLGVDLPQTLAFTSPIYRMELLLTARHFAQSSALYAGISMSNDRSEPVLAAFQQAAKELAELIQAHDKTAFDALFGDVSRYFGDFRDAALAESSYLIDRVVERSDPAPSSDSSVK